jgi:hypothetical protein
MATDDLEQFEAPATVRDNSEGDQIRRVLNDVYTFVRSQEVNRSVASFTLDHYIDEAKRRIKDPRILRAASDPSKGVGVRPSKLEALAKLEQDFTSMYNKAKEMADKVGS